MRSFAQLISADVAIKSWDTDVLKHELGGRLI